MVLDSIRTAVVWGVGLAFLGEHFHWLQLVGATQGGHVKLRMLMMIGVDTFRSKNQLAEFAKRFKMGRAVALLPTLISEPQHKIAHYQN